MGRFAIPDRDDAPIQSKPVLDAVMKQIGFLPNLHRLLSISPSALNGFSGLQITLKRSLDMKTRTGIALAVSEVNRCDYCLSTHSFNAENFAGISPDEVALNRQGRSSDPKRGVAIAFAKRLTELRGNISNSDFVQVRVAGFSDATILEIVALSVQFTFTNTINNVAATDIDFPSVAPANRH